MKKILRLNLWGTASESGSKAKGSAIYLVAKYVSSVRQLGQKKTVVRMTNGDEFIVVQESAEIRERLGEVAASLSKQHCD